MRHIIRRTSELVRRHPARPGHLPGDARRYTLAPRDGRPIAAAVLSPPATVPSPAAQARWATHTLTRCGPLALRRTLRYLRRTEADVPEGGWTLEFIGVAPAAAGRGAARQLIDRLLVDTPAGVFLTTADPTNVALYQRFGFDPLRHLTVGPLNVAAMYRPDRNA
ncbi:GNAT family N-acetyltransferase [Streptomyces sp. NPDC013953]|uniref:GNAT family N-acetyltransferase n=1 Tax=Streptomyces sp. NPDC013953 TaxID=3364868 RepID=UPI0036FD3567